MDKKSISHVLKIVKLQNGQSGETQTFKNKNKQQNNNKNTSKKTSQ